MLTNRTIEAKCRVLEGFGIEITRELITALESCKSEIQLDNYVKQLIDNHLN